MRVVLLVCCVSVCLAGCDGSGEGDGDPTAPVSFTQDVAPILVSKCGNCHIKQSKGKYSVASYSAMMKDSGDGPMIVAGKPEESRLIELVETGEMPKMGHQLDPADVRTLKNWVAGGAKFDGGDQNAELDGVRPAG